MDNIQKESFGLLTKKDRIRIKKRFDLSYSKFVAMPIADLEKLKDTQMSTTDCAAYHQALGVLNTKEQDTYKKDGQKV